ncbi:beta-glucanosyltransferase gel4 [Zalerion maritima]|uniref:Beta-glucanosyltransferase gel4 n=1 Tax=Zalerion maritima TaxID=339359 RepID=A0AAD5RX61_9PEZI|nr:beta-glucanosyltransferase gel4 [Zalerion maritima]
MNTVKSFWVGWGALCVGGAGAYYFAKKEINASRTAKLEEARRRRLANTSLEYSENVPSHPLSSSTMAATPARTDAAGSPSQEAGNDPAPTRHAPETERQRVLEKSKYEPAVPYTSRKGDRFS